MSKYSSVVLTLYKGRYNSSDGVDKQYRTFGEFDYITISDVPVIKDTNALDYLGMWEKTENISNELAIGESCHNLYAVRTSTEEDDAFWDCDSPYLFVSLLQFKPDINGKTQEYVGKLTDYFKEKSKNNTEFRFAVYYSLDLCDFVIFIKSDLYKTGAEQIQSFSSSFSTDGRSDSYCYSICGIDFNRLDLLKDEIFEKIMVCFVVKDIEKYQEWYQEFSKIFPLIESKEIEEHKHFNYNRLGNEDVCINIMDCNIKNVVTQMCKNGCLSMENDVLQDGIMKLRIHFDTEPYINKLDIHNNGKQEDNSDGSSSYSDGSSYIDDYKEKVGDLAKQQLYPFVNKALIEVLKSCSYQKNEHFAKDVQKCIHSAIYMLYEKMNEYCEAMAERKWSKVNQITYNESVVMVIQGIMSIVNGSMHTDRMFFQSPGFNAVLYDIPVKLLAFYNYYVECLVNALNDNDKKEFCYLLSPDLYLSITIRKLFDIKDEYPMKRFLLGKIPVKTIFEPKRLMRELAHETAHCVGDGIRLREKRWQYTISMLAETMATWILSHSDEDSESENVLNNVYAKMKDEKKERMHEELTRVIKKYIWNNSGKKNIMEEFDYYQVKTVKEFEHAIHTLLDEQPHLLIKIIDDKVKEAYKGSNRGMIEYFQDAAALIMVIKKNIEQLLLDVNFIVKSVHTLTNESFADLVMCETLGIEMQEYVEMVYAKHKEDIEDKEANFLNSSTNAIAERVVSVVRCCGSIIGELKSDINEDGYKKYRAKLMCYSGEYQWPKDVERALPAAVIRINIKYLKECRIKIQEQKSELKAIRDIYENAVHKDIFSSITTILNYSS